MNGTILLHIQHRDGRVEHQWHHPRHLKDELVHLMMGHRSSTFELVNSKDVIIIPKIMPYSDLAETQDWLRPSAVCRACAWKLELPT